MRKPLLVGVLCVSVAACAGRKADPVSVVQGYDSHLTCTDIHDEITANEGKISRLNGENDSAHNNNIAWGVVGTLLFWPAYFAIDDGNAEVTEIDALHSRDNHLLNNAAQMNCDGIKPATANGIPAPTYNNGQFVSGSLSPQAWAAAAPQKACKLANGKITVKTEDDCKTAGGQPAPF